MADGDGGKFLTYSSEAVDELIGEVQDELTALTDTVTALEARVEALEDGSSPEPPDPPDPPTGARVVHGSSSEITPSANSAQKAYEALESELVANSGQSGPVLMLDHRYNGDTIDTAIPSWWKSKGLRFGMLNGKGPMNANSSAFANLPKLAKSLPAGFTLYLLWWHEPEDNVPASQWVPAFAGFVKAVRAIPASNFAEGASIVPVFNLHGSMFRPGSMYEKWGPVDNWNPYPAIPAADRPFVLATVNGYADPASTSSGKGEDPEWCFGPAFDKMRSWGATRLGICEWGAQPADKQAGYIKLIGPWLEQQDDVEVFCYFHSGVGGNAGTAGWSLKTPEAFAAFAELALNGRRA